MRRRFATLAAGAMLVLAVGSSPALATTHRSPAYGARADFVCAGGSIPGGSYGSMTITGTCTVDAGSITVRRDLVVKANGILLAWYGGNNLTVTGNLRVERDGGLVLGCGLPTSYCVDDPGDGSYSVTGNVGHDLEAEGALAAIVHHSSVGHDIDQHGGGGGLTCDPVIFGSPLYSTYEDTTVGGSVSITGVRTCWLGFLMNTVGHNVDFNNNRTAVVELTGPDGNEVAGNWIGGNLNCARNLPAAQIGDSGLPLNVVGHHATGQCAKLKA